LYSLVIDSATLINLTHLQQSKAFFHYLHNIFHTIYIPGKVKNEYAAGLQKEPHREWLLKRLQPDQGFYRLCTSYDSIVLITVEKFEGIDPGEAETYAQYRKINAQFLVSDDKRFIKALISFDKYIKVYTTLHLICWLEISGYLKEWERLIKTMHGISAFSYKDLRITYTDILQRFGIDKSKKEISLKCSLKNIISR
jgi:predicted nucleic acid-binding protein